MAFQKASTVRTGPCPRQVKPGHSSHVQFPGSSSLLNPIELPRMNDYQHAERDKDDNRPYRGHAMTDECLPADDREGRGHDQSRIREPKRCPFTASDLACPALDAA